MSGVNKAIILGRLGADPEVRSTQSGTSVCTMSIATSEKFKDRDGELQEKTQWHRVIAWGQLADVCGQYLRKGREVYVEGVIEYRKWTDKENIERYTTEIKALSVQFIGGQNQGEQSGQSQQSNQGGGQRQQKAGQGGGFGGGHEGRGSDYTPF